MLDTAALGGSARRTPPAVIAAEWLTPLAPATRLIFWGAAAARAAAAQTFGVPFCEQVCRARTQGPRAVLWLGPDEYLLIAPAAEPATMIGAQLTAALGGISHALVDVSHRQTAVEIHGPHAQALLAGGCPLDVDPAEFPVDACTRTVFAKAEIVLWRTGAETFRLECWRSYSDYVTLLLHEIARDYR